MMRQWQDFGMLNKCFDQTIIELFLRDEWTLGYIFQRVPVM